MVCLEVGQSVINAIQWNRNLVYLTVYRAVLDYSSLQVIIFYLFTNAIKPYSMSWHVRLTGNGMVTADRLTGNKI